MDTPDLRLPPLPTGRLDRTTIRERLRLIADLRREHRRALGGLAAGPGLVA